jgi:hypothetical protein
VSICIGSTKEPVSETMVLIFMSQPLSAHGKGASNIFIRQWRIIFEMTRRLIQA